MRMRLFSLAATAALMAALLISPALVDRSIAAPAVMNIQAVQFHYDVALPMVHAVEIQQSRVAATRSERVAVLDRALRPVRSGQAIKATAKSGWGSGRLRVLSDG